MKYVSGILAALPLAALASPLSKRQTVELCGQWDNVEAGDYILYNNLWGMDNAESGEQCTTLVGVCGDSLQWTAEWTWIGDQYSVKSYPNAVLDVEPRPLSQISTMPTTWQWSYTGSDLIANVAYDIFTGATADGAPDYEFMVWLGSLGGAGPISETGSTIGTPTIGGVTWSLYTGSHSQMTVYSFVAQSNVENYSGDLMDFVNYLVQNHGVSTDQIMQSVGAGTEPFIGSNAVFTTNEYSISVS